MNSPNHIIGGVAITGISLSFWDINIFSNEIYLGVCIFSALLPDIDHTKSVIGKLFYPLAKYLDKNFGHRTLTHSLSFMVPIFVFLLFLELNILNPIFETKGINYSLIFLFAFLSHLILDMLTVQGIPLFYPFLKNPCVIPANPNLRFRSGNIKSETMAFMLFSFVLFSSYDLFTNGFWTTYNRSFGTVKHAFREFRDSENLVYCQFDYLFNGEKESGHGYIIDATETHIEIYSTEDEYHKGKITFIDSKDNRFKNIKLLPSKTEFKYAVKDFEFFNMNLSSLNDSLSNKIVSGKIISSNEFQVNNYKSVRNTIELKKEISPYFNWIINDSLKSDLTNKLKVKQAKLRDLNNDNFIEKRKLERLKNQLFQEKLNLKNSKDLYSKNKAEKEIIIYTKKIENFNLNLKNSNVLNQEISILKTKINNKTTHYFTGDLKIYFVPKFADSIKLASNN